MLNAEFRLTITSSLTMITREIEEVMRKLQLNGMMWGFTLELSMATLMIYISEAEKAAVSAIQ